MRTQESTGISLLRKELEYRNYSPRTIGTYCNLLECAERALQKPLSSIAVDEFKGYLHGIITQKQVSTSCINQNISAFKIYLQDVLHGQWVNFQMK
jgi:hypothetical protein